MQKRHKHYIPTIGEQITKNKVIDKTIDTFEELFEKSEKHEAVFVTTFGLYIPASQIISRVKIWRIKSYIDNKCLYTLKNK